MSKRRSAHYSISRLSYKIIKGGRLMYKMSVWMSGNPMKIFKYYLRKLAIRRGVNILNKM